ncbi:hypothetical protein HanRHA438_Chr13g0584871 [Helianthus annuus]|nr:hypothetical protein HanRHA438_Chr13g0584871 [Helianthus annuus]
MEDLEKLVRLDRSSQDGRFEEAVCVWFVHLKMEDLKKLCRLPLKYLEEDRVLADQFIKVVQFCVKSKVWAGSEFSKKG